MATRINNIGLASLRNAFLVLAVNEDTRWYGLLTDIRPLKLFNKNCRIELSDTYFRSHC